MSDSATPWTVTRQAPLPIILQIRILEWVAIPFSRESSRSKAQTLVSCTASEFSTIWATREAPSFKKYGLNSEWGRPILTNLKQLPRYTNNFFLSFRMACILCTRMYFVSCVPQMEGDIYRKCLCMYRVYPDSRIHSSQFSSVIQSCPTLCNPMDWSMPGLPVHHQLLDRAQIDVYQVGDAIQPSHLCHLLLLLPSIFPAFWSFSMSQFFSSGGQSSGASASVLVLPTNIQDWFISISL